MNATRHVSVSSRQPRGNWPSGGGPICCPFSTAEEGSTTQSGTSDFITPPDSSFLCACFGFLPVLPLPLLLLLPLLFLLPLPRQNPNSIWMPANAKFVCRPNSWPFLLFWKLVVVLLAFSSSSTTSTSPLFYFILFPVWDSLAKAIGARGNNNQIKWHPELSLQEIRNAPMTAYPHSPSCFLFAPPLYPSPYPLPILRPFVSTHTGGDCCFLTLSVHKFLWHFIDLICWA